MNNFFRGQFKFPQYTFHLIKINIRKLFRPCSTRFIFIKARQVLITKSAALKSVFHMWKAAIFQNDSAAFSRTILYIYFFPYRTTLLCNNADVEILPLSKLDRSWLAAMKNEFWESIGTNEMPNLLLEHEYLYCIIILILIWMVKF